MINFDQIKLDEIDPMLKWYSFKHGAYLVSLIAQTRCEKAILQQVCFWYPKAKTKRGGYIWMIKPADEFQKAGVDYAPDTIQRAVRSLKNAGILEVERHFHPYRAILGPVYWMRPAVTLVDDTGHKISGPIKSKSYLEED